MNQPTKLMASVLLVLVAVAPTACGLLVDEEARLERARQSYANGDVASAIVDLRALLQANPEQADARLLLGEALLASRDLTGAEKEFNRGVEILRKAVPPADTALVVEATGKLAALQLALRDFASARANADAVLAAEPAHAAALMIAGQSAYLASDNAAARQYATRLLEASAGDPAAHVLLGFVDAREGAFAAAEMHFNEVLARQPNQHAIRLALIQLQLVTKQPVAALSTLMPLLVAAPNNVQLHQIVDLAALDTPETRAGVQALANDVEAANPASPVAAFLRGRVLLVTGDFAGAAAQFQEANAKQGGRYSTLGYYVSQRGLGNQAEAQRTLQEWVAQNPADQAAGFMLASTYLEKGEHDPARSLYEKLAGTGDLNSPVVLNNLAWLYGEVNDPRAIETARRAQELAPDSGAVTDTLGWLLVKAGQHEEGIRLLRRATQQAPDNEEIRLHLTAALAQVGDRDEVQRQIERILPSTPDVAPGGRPISAPQ